MSVLADVASQWQQELESILSPDMRFVRRVLVHQEVESTQDAARAPGACVGDVVVAIRQTCGRGQHGRAWLDTAELGTAMSFILPRLDSLQLALGCATACAETVESCVEHTAFIKWPNDIILLKRKVAGILIEQHSDVMIVGIGINVLQESWPEGFTDRAISLRQAGTHVDRLAVMATLLTRIDRALRCPSDDLVADFHRRDALIGSLATIMCDRVEHNGTIERIDPQGSLAIRTTDSEIVELPASSVSILSAHGDRIETDRVPARVDGEAGPPAPIG